MNVGHGTTLGVLPSVTADAYHADQVADRPTLSKSIIQILLNASPAHARHAHPRLNPDFERKEESKFDVGNVCHQVFLEGIDAVAIVPFDDWRTKAAKDERDAARDAGKIPLLARDYERVEEMLVAVRAQLAVRDDALFENGKPETTLVWEERGVTLRARLDWLLDDESEIHDLKTTSRSANPESWCRSTLFNIGADVQAALYSRGVAVFTGTRRPEFKFVVCETEPPYPISVVAMGPDVLTLADKKIDWALDLWRRCLETDTWPAYDSRIHYAELPTWEESRWLARELREVAA